MQQITTSQVRSLCPTGKAAIIEGLCLAWPDLAARCRITTPLRVAHFMAQIAHESDRFRTATEYASGAAYEGRKDLGNTTAGDGRRFRGRGLIQCTGRANYRAFSDWARLNYDGPAPDFEAQPESLSEFPWALLSAVWFWTTRALNTYADADDVLTITRRINGGTNGLADRKALLTSAKRIFTAAAQATGRQVLRIGASGDDVAALQSRLNERGAGVVVDGNFGPATERVVRRFQSSAGLTADGVVGPATWSALGA